METGDMSTMALIMNPSAFKNVIKYKVLGTVANALHVDAYVAKFKENFAEHQEGNKENVVSSFFNAMKDTAAEGLTDEDIAASNTDQQPVADGTTTTQEATTQAGTSTEQASAQTGTDSPSAMSYTPEQIAMLQQEAYAAGQQDTVSHYDAVTDKMGFFAKKAFEKAENEIEAEANAASAPKKELPSETVERDMAEEGITVSQESKPPYSPEYE